MKKYLNVKNVLICKLLNVLMFLKNNFNEFLTLYDWIQYQRQIPCSNSLNKRKESIQLFEVALFTTNNHTSIIKTSSFLVKVGIMSIRPFHLKS